MKNVTRSNEDQERKELVYYISETILAPVVRGL